MDVIGQFEPGGESHEDEIPRYNQRGRLLSEEERQRIADRLGVCLRCNVQLSVKRGILARRPLTNDNVFQGICIRCNPRKVPQTIFQAWDKRNRPLRSARVTPAGVSSMNNRTTTGSERGGDDSQRSVSPRRVIRQASPLPRSPAIVSNNSPQQRPRYASPRQRIRPASTTRVVTNTSNDASSNVDSTRTLRPQQHQQRTRRQNASAPRPTQMNSAATLSPSSSRLLVENSSAALEDTSSNHSTSHHSSTIASPRRTPPRLQRLDEGTPRIVQAMEHINVSSIFSQSEGSDSEAWDTSMETSTIPNSNPRPNPDEWKGDSERKPMATYLQELAENLDDPAILRSILHNIRNTMESNDDTGLAVFQTKEILVHCMDNARVADVAMGVFWRASAVDGESKRLVMESGVVGLALQCLEQHRNDVELSLWVFGFLTSVSMLMDNKAQIVDQGGLTLILDHLSVHGSDERILEWGARCLYSLVCGYENGDVADTTTMTQHETIISNHIKLLHQSDVINIVLGSLKLHPSSNGAGLWSMKLLWRLMALDEGISHQRRRRSIMQRITVIHKLVKADYIAVASNLLRLDVSSELQLLAAELMAMVVLGSFGESDMLQRALLVEYASQSAPIIIQKMEGKPEDRSIQKSGCALISSLCTIEGDMPQFLIENKAIDSLLSAMILLEDDLDVVSAGAWALWKLSCAWKTSTETIKWDITQIICTLGILATVAERHPKERDILNALSGFVQNVAGAPGLEFGDFPVSNLVKGIFIDPNAGGVQALISLCRHYPESSWTILQKLGVPSVLEAFYAADPILLDPFTQMMLSATANSTVASVEMSNAGMVSACAAALDKVSEREQAMSIATLLTTILSSNARSSLETPQPTMPPGFCVTVMEKLKRHRSDGEELCICLLNMATEAISNIHPSSESMILLPWLVDSLLDKSLSHDFRITIGRAMWAVGATRVISDSGQLRSVLAAVLTYMREFNGSDEKPINIEAEEIAAGALHGVSLCVVENVIDLDISQVDIFFASTYKAMRLGLRGEAFMVQIISAMYNFFKVHPQKLFDSGLIVILMDAMAAFRESEAVQGRCCVILAEMTSSENIHLILTICEMDGITFLLEALAAFPKSKEIQSEASKSIAHLSTNPEVRGLVCALGGMDSILKAITFFEDDVILLERAYSALLNLTSDVPEFLLDYSAVVQTIVDTMSSHAASGSLLKNGLGILQNVCMKGPEAKETIASKGGIETVLSAMENHMTIPAVLKRSFSTLWSLAVLPANQRRIAEAGGISVVVTVMLASIPHERVQQQGCGCIYTLALDPHNRMNLRQAGAQNTLVLSAQAHYSSLGVQTEVCKTLACLSTPGEGGSHIQSVSSEEVIVISQAMSRFRNDETIQVIGCQALVNFLQAGNAADLLASHRPIFGRAVRDAIAAYPTQCANVSNDFQLLLSQY